MGFSYLSNNPISFSFLLYSTRRPAGHCLGFDSSYRQNAQIQALGQLYCDHGEIDFKYGLTLKKAIFELSMKFEVLRYHSDTSTYISV